jgi:hypothetical protein
MRLPGDAHRSQPWRIHELTRDFRLEDVWDLPASGRAEDFPRLVELMTGMDPGRGSSRAPRALFAIRSKLGDLLGLDEGSAGVGARVPALVDRLPSDLRGPPPPPEFRALPFESIYMTGDEFAAETANRTVHGVLHLGWVPTGAGIFRGRLAVLVKPNGAFGSAYLAAIKPFRHLVVYPAMLREIGAAWERRSAPQRPSRK